MIAVREQPRESAIDVQQPPITLAGEGGCSLDSNIVAQRNTSTEENASASFICATGGNSAGGLHHGS